MTSAPVSVLVNAPPTVALTSPADGATFTAPADVTVTASASDTDGAVGKVEFYQGATKIGEDTTAPYQVTWTGVAAGVYNLTARATDDRGAATATPPVSITVIANLAPTADAYVRDSAWAGTNFGSATTLQVRVASGSGDRWTYVRFDTTGVATVRQARLRLFGALSATTSATVMASTFPVANTTWGEATITWNNKPATGGTALSTVTLVNNSTVPQWYEWDVTAYLQQEKAAGRHVVTLAVRNNASSSPFDMFNSREAASNRPVLQITP